MKSIKTIYLPSFIRRTLKTDKLKTKLQALDCKLHRIGRSRNWRLEVNSIQINAIIIFIEQEAEQSWLWIIKLLKLERQPLNHKALLKIAKQEKSMTIAKLILLTACTIKEARKVIDELEELD